MARKVQVLLVDDLDGTDLGTKGETVTFALDGASYEIDLSDKNAKAMRDAMGNYVQHARKAARSSGRGSSRASAPTSAGSNSAETKAARAWLVENGHLAAESRGRIKGELWELYRNRGQMAMNGTPSPAKPAANSDSISTKAQKETAKAKEPVAV